MNYPGKCKTSLSATIYNVFDKPYEIAEVSYDPLLNLAVPFLMYFISSIILGFMLYQLFKSIIQDENNILTYLLKVILTISIAYLSFVSIVNTVDMFVLNIAVSLTVILFFAIIIWLITAVFNNEERQNS